MAHAEDVSDLAAEPYDENELDEDEEASQDAREHTDDRFEDVQPPSSGRRGRDEDENKPRAWFSLRHPFQHVDPVLAARVIWSLGAVGALIFVAKRLARKRLDVSTVWLWRSPTEARPKAQASGSLSGQRLAVCENVPLQGRKPSLGVPCRATAAPAPADHPAVQALTAAGAVVVGATRLDPLALCGDFQSLTTRLAGNPGHPGRALLGPAAAAAAVVAAGGADVALGVDSGAELLLAAACSGCVAFRASEGAVDVADCLVGSSSTCSSSFVTRDSLAIPKIGKALSLPGGGATDDVMRVLFTSDLFELLTELPGEKVTNGIVSRAVTTWLSDSENARQIALLSFLARALVKWTRFADDDRSNEAVQVHVLEAISRAHAVIVGYETAAAVEAKSLGVDALPPQVAAELASAREVTRDDYTAALELRQELHACMRDALRGATILLPILAGTPPRVKGPGAPLPAAAAAVLRTSRQFAALISMVGFPTAVLPVPGLGRKGGPWAVALMGLYRMDQQVLYLASKLGPQIIKTADLMEKEAAKPKAEQNGRGAGGAPSTSGAAAGAPPSAATAAARADEFKDQGNEHFKRGDYAKSIQLYSAAIAVAPRTAVYYSNRAMAYLKLEDFGRAIADCDASIAIRWSAKAALRRGTARMATGQWAEALDDFDAVLQAEPNNRGALEQAEECRHALATSSYLDDGQQPAQEEGLL